MAHPKGGKGNTFSNKHTFDQTYAKVGLRGIKFHSTTGELIAAKQGIAQDKVTKNQ